MAGKKGLGRGLDALLARAEPNADEVVRQVPLAEIEPNPFQPRRVFDEDKLAELAASIRERGVVQPIVVRPLGEGYQLVAGERRWRAAALAGLPAVPAVVREVSDREALELALVENIQRQDLNPMEEARAYLALQETLGLTQEQLAARLGKSRPAVANTMRLLGLDGQVQRLVEEGRLSMGHGRALAALEGARRQREAGRRIVDEGLNVRQAEALVKRLASGISVSGSKAREKDEDPLLQAVAAGLRERLATPVHLRGTARRGTIEIAYFGLEDVERLYEVITGHPLDL